MMFRKKRLARIEQTESYLERKINMRYDQFAMIKDIQTRVKNLEETFLLILKGVNKYFKKEEGS